MKKVTNLLKKYWKEAAGLALIASFFGVIKVWLSRMGNDAKSEADGTAIETANDVAMNGDSRWCIRQRRCHNNGRVYQV